MRTHTKGSATTTDIRASNEAILGPFGDLGTIWSNCKVEEQKAILARPAITRSSTLKKTVSKILDDVKRNGDQAVEAYTRKFDLVSNSYQMHGYLTSSTAAPRIDLFVGSCEIDPDDRQALEAAAANIASFHREQVPRGYSLEVQPGVRCSLTYRPLQSVGLYVPAGGAPLPSTVLMLGIPAALAGIPRRVMAVPPRADGTVHPAVLAAAKIAGITEIYVAGGAQGIAALAYGTETLQPVDKIFGPGNSYVTEAKLQVASEAGRAAIDMPAGPSEVMVVADHSANPDFVAADLLSQAEHGPDSQVFLVQLSGFDSARLSIAMGQQLANLRRSVTAAQSLKHSRNIRAQSSEEALAIVDSYGPEHLVLLMSDASNFSEKVQNAGSIFVGPWSPEACGDYASGPNHVLPTYGQARSYSGVTLASFYKSITTQELSEAGLRGLAPVVKRLARLEGLDAHEQAVAIRLQDSGLQGNCGSPTL